MYIVVGAPSSFVPHKVIPIQQGLKLKRIVVNFGCCQFLIRSFQYNKD